MTYSCEGRYYIEEKDRRGVTIYLTKTGKETGSLTQEQLEGSRVEPTLVSDQEISKACNLGGTSKGSNKNKNRFFVEVFPKGGGVSSNPKFS